MGPWSPFPESLSSFVFFFSSLFLFDDSHRTIVCSYGTTQSKVATPDTSFFVYFGCQCRGEGGAHKCLRVSVGYPYRATLVIGRSPTIHLVPLVVGKEEK